jgi:hypothetical protein
MKKYVLLFLLLMNIGCSTTKKYYSDDVYYSNPIDFFNEYNLHRNWYMERNIFPQFYYGYPYVPFDLLISQPGISRAPRKVNTPKQNNSKQDNQKQNIPNQNSSPIRKFDNKKQ